MIKLLSFFSIVFLTFTSLGQRLEIYGKRGGLSSIGLMRVSFNSVINEKGFPPTGTGAHGRIQLSDRFVYEGFFDFISYSNDLSRINDVRFGPNLLIYIRKNTFPIFQPYITVGTTIGRNFYFDLSNRKNKETSWFYGAQIGLGTHFNLTPRVDISLTCQYFISYSRKIETTSTNQKTEYMKSKGYSEKNQITTVLSINYRIFDLWGSKKEKTNLY